MPFQRAVFGSELSSVQYRALDEQLFRAMACLFDQKQRHGVARLVGMRAPVSIVTPLVQKKPAKKEMTKEFLNRKYEKLPFALRSLEALRQIVEREQKIAGGYASAPAKDEPIPAKRRIR